MFKKSIKRFLARFGYEIRKITKDQWGSRGFTLYTYLKEDGSFDYEKYRHNQQEANLRKLNKVWVLEENIAFLSDYIKNIIGRPKFGICHGTRRGKEQEWFKKYLNCEVIGTEISDTAELFPNTIQWDFHKTKPVWIEATDFIYSNSFDHSYDPENCINAWMSCVKTGGICIIELSSCNAPNRASETDPFGVDVVELPYLIATWGEGKYGVRELIKAPTKRDIQQILYFIVIQKF